MSTDNDIDAGADSEWLHAPISAIREAVTIAIAEDLTPLGDLTSTLLGADPGQARFAARAPGRIAGTRAAREALRQVDESIEVSWTIHEGSAVSAGDELAVVSGPFRSILTAERTALNFLSHLSGIATLTSQYVKAAAEGGSAKIWDTRKTTPGLRSLQKAAVRAGGGRNHRENLSDWLLIKDNHLANMGITAAVALGKDRWPARTIHVECDGLHQCVEALEAGADAVLLDNMTPEEVSDCVAEARRIQGDFARRTLLEVSGGITLATVGAYSATGVDQISVGAITNSAPVLDIGLDLA